MKDKKNLYFSVIIILLSINLTLSYYLKRGIKRNFDLQKSYLLKCMDEKNILSVFDKSFQFQGNLLNINNDSVKSSFQIQTPTPLLLINQHVCSECLDILLLELEQLRIDSLSIIHDLTVVLLSDTQDYRTRGICSIFDGKNNPTYVLNIKDISMKHVKQFPEISFMLVDRNSTILSYCEFLEQYPFIFSSALKNINKSYRRN